MTHRSIRLIVPLFLCLLATQVLCLAAPQLMPIPGSATNVWVAPSEETHVRDLAKRGIICRVFGHQWRSGRPGDSTGYSCADYHPNTTYRTCTICGSCESQTSNDWKGSF